MRYVSTPGAPISRAPLSQAVISRGLVFTSGIVGVHPETGTLAASVEEQARQALRNLGEILRAAGSGFERLTKVTILLVDIGDYATVNGVYTEFVLDSYPARSAFQAVLPAPDILVEIEAVAELNE